MAMMLLVSACAMPAERPVPQAVRLTDSTLTLRLSDGTRCRVAWPEAPVGRMETCGPGYGYAVKLDGTSPRRMLVAGLDLVQGGGPGLPPLAEVVITDPAGIDHVFTASGRLRN